MSPFTGRPYLPAELTPTGRPTRAAITRRMNELFVSFGGVASYVQLRDQVGLDHEQIQRRANSGELFDTTARGPDDRINVATVFARDASPLTLAGARWRALMSAPEPAYLGEMSACALFDTTPPTTKQIYVVHPGGSWRPPAGVVCVRTTKWSPRDFTRRRGYPTTTFGRSIVDAAARVDAETLDDVLDTATSIRVYNESDLRRAIRERPSFGGSRAAEAARLRLDDKSGEFRSKFERLTMRLVQQSKVLPPAVVNVLVEGYRPDFRFVGTRAILECDGNDYHRSDAQRIADEERAERLWQMGFVIKPLRWNHVKYEGERTLRRIEEFTLANLAPPQPRVAQAWR